MTSKILPLSLVLVVAAFAVGLSGCRMGGSPDDYCIPTYLNRDDDYRGCDPYYRAGSIFYGNADYSDTSSDPNCVNCSLTNTGRFGRTDSIGSSQPTRISPRKTWISGGESGDAGDNLNVPTIEDLLRGRPTESPVDTTPYDPEIPQRPPVQPPPQPFRQPILPDQPTPAPAPMETMPFSSANPKTTGRTPSITVDDLRQMDNDPTITDIRIINVEDAVNNAFQNAER